MQTTLHQFQKSKPKTDRGREERTKIATETLAAIKSGSYGVGNVSYQLAPMIQHTLTNTVFEPAISATMSGWKNFPSAHAATAKTTLAVHQTSTLEALRSLAQVPGARVAVLNFASAHKPGGGFLTGAQAQEESLARSSTLYCSLSSPTGQLFYNNVDKDSGYYSHTMLWSPNVTFFRDDRGHWLAPCMAAVITSAAVNAGVVKAKLPEASHDEADARIRSAMHERMARILYLLERQGSTHVVLGSFGSGVFKNDIPTVAQVWAELVGPGCRFERSFVHISFAIIDERTYMVFKEAFIQRCGELWASLV